MRALSLAVAGATELLCVDRMVGLPAYRQHFVLSPMSSGSRRHSLCSCQLAGFRLLRTKEATSRRINVKT
jgi:hypothetical protein